MNIISNLSITVYESVRTGSDFAVAVYDTAGCSNVIFRTKHETHKYTGDRFKDELEVCDALRLGVCAVECTTQDHACYARASLLFTTLVPVIKPSTSIATEANDVRIGTVRTGDWDENGDWQDGDLYAVVTTKEDKEHHVYFNVVDGSPDAKNIHKHLSRSCKDAMVECLRALGFNECKDSANKIIQDLVDIK